MQQHDVFISYRHSRKGEVLALCEHLDRAGIRYFRDEQRRDDDDSIQRTIESGLRHSKLLLAWYDPGYLQSKACAWEFSRALLAAHAGGGGLRRIVCVDPSRSFAHIVPESLADQARLVSLDDPSDLNRLLRERADAFAEPLGALVAGTSPGWYERERPTHPTWVGRAGDLIRLFHQLDHGRLAMHGGARAPVALTGWGGEGKTMLAEQYALRFAAAYPGGVVWLSGATEDGVTPRAGEWLQQLESSLVAIANGKLALPAGELTQGMVDPRQRIRVLKEAIDRRLLALTDPAAPAIAPYLWIVDDLPDRLNARDQRLWLPPGEQAHCIATIRESGGVGAVFHTLPVLPLEEAEALRLLTKGRPLQRADEQAIACQIVEAVGRLPLALEIGAALVESRGLRRYLDLLQSPGDRTLERLVAAMGAALPTNHESSITKTFLRSLDQLPGAESVVPPGGAGATDQDQATWLVLRLAALLAPEPLPDAFAVQSLLAAGFEAAQAASCCEVALVSLARAALFRRATGHNSDESRTHALVARTVQEAKLDPPKRTEVLTVAIEAGEQWLEIEQVKTPIEIDRRLLPVIARLTELASSPETARLANNAGSMAVYMGQLTDARRLLERCRALLGLLLPSDHPDLMACNLNLARTLHAQGDFAGARSIQERTLAILRQLAGQDSMALIAKQELALTMRDQGDWGAACALQREVLDTLRQSPGDGHLSTLKAMTNLAVTLRRQGELAAAGALHQEVLGVCRRVFGEEHSNTQVARLEMDWMTQAPVALPDKLVIGERLLAEHRLRFGDEHRETLNAMANLAITRHERGGDAAGAQELLSEVVATRERVLGEQHPDTLHSRDALASAMEDQGDLIGARALREQVLRQRRQVLGEAHPATLDSMHNLATTMLAQGELPGAKALLDEVLAAKRQVLGPEHPETLLGMLSLAATMRDQGSFREALALQNQVVKSRRVTLGDSHPDTLAAMAKLAETMQQQGNLADASALAQSVWTARRMALGEEHPQTLRAMDAAASLSHDQGDDKEALKLYEEVLAVRIRVCGEEDATTLNSMNNVALLKQNCGDLSAARALYERLLSIEQRLFGESQPRTLTTKSNLATLLDAQGDHEGARSLGQQILDARRRLLGNSHPDTLISMNNLALTMREQGNLAAAEALQRELLQLHPRVDDEGDPRAMIWISNLAVTLAKQGKLIEARDLQQKVLTGRRRMFGDWHPQTSGAARLLYETLLGLGEKGPIADFEQALEVSFTTRYGASVDTLKWLHEELERRRSARGMAARRIEHDTGDDFNTAASP